MLPKLLPWGILDDCHPKPLPNPCLLNFSANNHTPQSFFWSRLEWTRHLFSPCAILPQLKQKTGKFSYSKLTQCAFPAMFRDLPLSNDFWISIIIHMHITLHYSTPSPAMSTASSTPNECLILLPIAFVIQINNKSCI
jgi:hypothetical protein